MAWTNPRTWLAGETVTAALLNVQIRDNLKALGDPWTAYTPSWTADGTNPSLGNGTLSGRFMQAGKLLHWRISLTMGSTTTFGSGAWLFSLPTTLAVPTNMPIGDCVALDASPINRKGGAVYVVNATTLGVLMHSDSKLGDATFTWAASDQVQMSGTYEAG